MLCEWSIFYIKVHRVTKLKHSVYCANLAPFTRFSMHVRKIKTFEKFPIFLICAENHGIDLDTNKAMLISKSALTLWTHFPDQITWLYM